MTARGDARKRLTESARRVRVSFTGDAVESWPGGPVRVFVGASQCVMVDPAWAGVTVEDVRPPMPTGRYAVVSDAEGLEWVLADPPTVPTPWKCLTLDRWKSWEDIEDPRLESQGRPVV